MRLVGLVGSGLTTILDWFQYLIIHMWSGKLYLAGRVMVIGISASLIMVTVYLIKNVVRGKK